MYSVLWVTVQWRTSTIVLGSKLGLASSWKCSGYARHPYSRTSLGGSTGESGHPKVGLDLELIKDHGNAQFMPGIPTVGLALAALQVGPVTQLLSCTEETTKQGDDETRRRRNKETRRPGDEKTRGRGIEETRRRGDEETRRRGNEETRRRGDEGTRKRGDEEMRKRGDGGEETRKTQGVLNDYTPGNPSRVYA